MTELNDAKVSSSKSQPQEPQTTLNKKSQSKNGKKNRISSFFEGSVSNFIMTMSHSKSSGDINGLSYSTKPSNINNNLADTLRLETTPEDKNSDIGIINGDNVSDPNSKSKTKTLASTLASAFKKSTSSSNLKVNQISLINKNSDNSKLHNIEKG
jgi:hypothetical protein